VSRIQYGTKQDNTDISKFLDVALFGNSPKLHIYYLSKVLLRNEIDHLLEWPRFLRIFTATIIADIWGDAPYSEAFKTCHRR